MSDTSPAIDRAKPVSDRRCAGGFTLLELVVVLALLGLVTALVAPSGIRTIETWRRSSDVDAAFGALAALGAHAQQLGRPVELDAGAVPNGALPGLPEGWAVVLEVPLRVQANGACGDSHGELHGDDGYVQPFELQAPFCRTARAGAGPE